MIEFAHGAKPPAETVHDQISSKSEVSSKFSGKPSQKGVMSVDLDSVPEVDALLRRSGFGEFVRESITSPIGRNTSWRGRTTSGRDVFVKRLNGGDSASRFERSLSFERYLAAQPGHTMRSPTLYASDETTTLLVYDLIVGAETGGDLMVSESFEIDHARRIGAFMGELHDGTVPPDLFIDSTPPSLPPLHFFEGLPLNSYLDSSAAELEAWTLLQSDAPLTAALHRLRGWESAAERKPSHGDFRVDQLLFVDQDIYVTDWEEFRLADPARDVGAFIGEWLFRSMLDLVTDRGDSSFIDVEFTHDIVLARGTEKLERLLPLVHAFLETYLSRRGDVGVGFGTRATGFAGWHLIDRLIAGASSSHRLAGVQRASAGVGRQAVLEPQQFAAVFGFQEEKTP